MVILKLTADKIATCITQAQATNQWNYIH